MGQIAIGLLLLTGCGSSSSDHQVSGDEARSEAELWGPPAYLVAMAQADSASQAASQERAKPVDPAAPTPAAHQPRVYGDDPALDDLWRQCEQGLGAACDQLFEQAPGGSDYEAFGLNCGNRPDILRCGPEMDAPPTPPAPPTLPPPAG